MNSKILISKLVGEYLGWFRTNGSPDYEDIIGKVKISLEGESKSTVVIENIELGLWRASINSENTISGKTQDGKLQFELTMGEKEKGSDRVVAIEGTMFNDELEPNCELYFEKLS